jgi:hypothetical protein
VDYPPPSKLGLRPKTPLISGMEISVVTEGIKEIYLTPIIALNGKDLM